MGVVIRTTPSEPLHPVVALFGSEYDRLPGELDTSLRESDQYLRHVVETIRPPEGLDVGAFLAAENVR
jgi:hypothetical protein